MPHLDFKLIAIHLIGGDEIYLLCEKVNKKEIRVRFFEVDNEGNQQWEAFGHFNESDVHHQVAIVFRTPPYRDQTISKSAQVYLQLYRQRDGEFSEPRTFIYKPKNDINLADIAGDSLTAKGSGIQECVLSRIKMENQPPGFKRRKYNHQQQQQSSLTRMGKGAIVGAIANSTSNTTNTTNSDGTSYSQRRNANKNRIQVKLHNNNNNKNSHNSVDNVVIKTENETNSEFCQLNSTTQTAITTITTNHHYSNVHDQIDTSFCPGKFHIWPFSFIYLFK